MEATTYTLEELGAATGIEARTIRNYIERGLLPGAQSRGRAASYLPEHLDRLRVIKTLRRAWPNLPLTEIRIRLQQLTPENIRALAEGRIAAVVTASACANTDEVLAEDEEEECEDEEVGASVERPLGQLPGTQRLVHALRQLTGGVPSAPASKAETWQHIAVTEDVELSVRAGFSKVQLAAFRELADLLRDLLTGTDVIPSKPTSDKLSPEVDT